MDPLSNIDTYTDSGRSRVCADAVIALRKCLGLSQASFEKVLKCSAMEVSRMERGYKLTANLCIQLGNIAGDPACWFFWERARPRSSDVLRIHPDFHLRTQKDETVLRVVHPGLVRELKHLILWLFLYCRWCLVLGTHGGADIPDKIGIVPNAVFATPKTCAQIQHGLLVSR